MDIRPKQVLAMAALAGGLAFGGATLASAQEPADDSTTTTPEDTTTTDDTTTTEDTATEESSGSEEDCPHGDRTADDSAAEDGAATGS